MATLCTHCGNPLPRDDARFCSNCGRFLAAPVKRPSKDADAQQEERRAAPREQVAFSSPSSSPAPASSREAPPSWMGQLDREIESKNALRSAGFEPSEEQSEPFAMPEQDEESKGSPLSAPAPEKPQQPLQPSPRSRFDQGQTRSPGVGSAQPAGLPEPPAAQRSAWRMDNLSGKAEPLRPLDSGRQSGQPLSAPEKPADADKSEGRKNIAEARPSGFNFERPPAAKSVQPRVTGRSLAEELKRERLADTPTSAVPANKAPVAPIEKPEASAKLQPPSQAGSSSEPSAPQRELRVKVWEGSAAKEAEQAGTARKAPGSQPSPEEEQERSKEQDAAKKKPDVPEKFPTNRGLASAEKSPLPEQKAFPQPAPAPEKAADEADKKQQPAAQGDIEDLPTRPVETPPRPDLLIQRGSTPRPPQSARKAPPTPIPETAPDIEQLDTMRLEALPAAKPQPEPARPQPEPIQRVQERKDSQPSLPPLSSSPSFAGAQGPGPGRPQPPYQPAPAPFQEPVQPQPSIPAGSIPAVQERSPVPHTPPPQSWQQQAPATPAPAAAPARTGGRRRPLGIALIIVVLLGLVGGGAWFLFFQGSSVSATTQFQDTTLGFSLSYPAGWQQQVDDKKGSASFFDSSHTAQVDILVTSASGQNAALYLQKTASQFGITNLKPGAPLTFGGASWQQVSGSLTQRGVTYSETLLVTQHGGHLFLIVQRAQQQVYAQEEQSAFAPLRSSFQFL